MAKRILLQGLCRSLLLRIYRPPICHQIKIWLTSHFDNNYEMISTAQVIYKQPPKTLEAKVYHQFLKELEYEVPDRYLARLENVRLIGKDGLLVLPDGSYAVEVAWNQGHLEFLPDYYNRLHFNQLKSNLKKN